MNSFQAFLLGYLLNALWQVPLLFLCGCLAASLLRSLGPSAEHRLWSTTLLLQVILPACPSPHLQQLVPVWSRHAVVSGHATVVTSVGEGFLINPFHLPARLSTCIVALYASIILLALLRLLWRLHRLAQLRRTALPLLLTAESALFWQRCGRHFTLRNTTIALSDKVAGPVTLGHRAPIILLPATLPLDEADLHTILAHEAAHIHRQDFLTNLLLEVVTLPLAPHPALRATRRRLAATRELVADSLAAHLLGRFPYAESLLRLAARLLEPVVPRSAPHAIGLLDANLLERRLMQLTALHIPSSLRRRALAVAASSFVGAVTCASAVALHLTIHPVLQDGAIAQPVSASGAAAPRTAHVASDVMAGSILTRVNPVYPQSARDAKIEGAIRLHAVIGKDGTIEHLDVLSGPEALRASSLEAVRQWTYKPFLLNGKPTAVETTITVNYSLQP